MEVQIERQKNKKIPVENENETRYWRIAHKIIAELTTLLKEL